MMSKFRHRFCEVSPYCLIQEKRSKLTEEACKAEALLEP